MLRKVLVANRGEIARRVIRACQDLGLRSVAVFSEADRDASYCRQADETQCIGPANPMKSYLSVDAIMGATAASGADAVHPGYGFLAESAALANAVENLPAVWIGPPSWVLRQIESKSHCRNIAVEVEVPIIPGSAGIVSTPEEVLEVAERVGYPILLKLDRGGGGKGIAKVESSSQAPALLSQVQRVGSAAFGSSDVYVEKVVPRARHIECQFIADAYGSVVCLGERECSIQRRHQKIIEESPAQGLSPRERDEITTYTRLLVTKMQYTGAGTIEFMYSDEYGMQFLEVNARLQVEHPVSELVSGQDIVQMQIRIAGGERLGISQGDVVLSGHAIEARCYAEDPDTFRPSPGFITGLSLPRTGRDLRVEHAMESGSAVSPYYDPMVAKVISWGASRDEARQRLVSALLEFDIQGVDTTIPFNIRVLESKLFKDGILTTDSIDSGLRFEDGQ